MSAGLLALLLLSASGARPAPAPAASAGPAEVRAAVDTFVRAFEALDWPAFRACFVEGATVFHPAPPHVLRTDSPESFERARAAVNIRLLAEKVALVTFHLPDGETMGGRTVVLQKLEAGWKIVHIHASNLPAPSTPSGR